MPDYSKGKIYKIVNSENDIIYIGSTTQTLAGRMYGHRCNAKTLTKSCGIYKAIREIGIERFKIVIIENYSCESLDELQAREYQIMKECKKADVELYNLMTEKGHDESTREKISKIHKGKTVSNETKEKMRIANIGRKHTDETKTKMRAAKFKRGSVNFSTSLNMWRFSWYENGKKRCKGFSANKYGERSAYRKAVRMQDEIYLIESDSDSD
jgi:group I intron endonuclease